MKKSLFLFAASLIIGGSATAQVKLGNNPTSINANSLLEMESVNKGMVAPRIALTAVNSPSPLSASLLVGTTVYNTATAGTGNNTVYANHYYFWNGAAWAQIADQDASIAILVPVLDNTITTPPTIHADGDSYIIPAGATGVWAGNTNKIATWDNNSSTWLFYTPVANNQTTVTTGTNAGKTYKYDGTNWVQVVAAATVYWQPGGNTGLTASNNTLGTLAYLPLRFITKGLERMVIDTIYNIHMGFQTVASNQFSTAMGYKTIASGITGTAMGAACVASGQNSTAMGDASVAAGTESGAWGVADSATGIGNGAWAIGYFNRATGDRAIALGTGTFATGGFSTTMGNNTFASGRFSVAMGINSIASGERSVAMNNTTTASDYASTAMGDQSKATAPASTSMGYQTTASGSVSTAMGSGSVSSGVASTAMGSGTMALGDYATAMGAGSVAANPHSGAWGVSDSATGTNSGAWAIGFACKAMGDRSFAIGSYVNVTHPGSFALGDLSNTNVYMNSTANNQMSARFAGGYQFYTNNSNSLGAALAPNATSWTSISDRRSKENIRSLNYGLNTVMQLHPVSYRYKGNENTSIGFIAQDVQDLVPEVVDQTTMGPNHDFLGVRYSELIPVLTKAIQEQQQLIEQLTKRVRELEAKK